MREHGEPRCLAEPGVDRRALFTAIEAIRANNADKDPAEVQRDIAREIAAMRAERRRPPPSAGS